jgi:enoyl-CoA hydratase/3-hydroxyacyl-CoA dehydrogenase
METADIEEVAVLGAGSMGHGISEVVALAGYSVTLRDIEQDLVDEGIENIRWSLEKLTENDVIESSNDVLARIDSTTDLEEAVSNADLVIEAAPERMDLKREIFSQLDECTTDAILASNTSSLSITDIADATESPERVVGLHFFNPPVKMDLVEVIYGDGTSDETAELAHDFVESIDKTPIYVRKDVNGFVVNSVLGPFLTEPAWMVSNGEATIEQADAAMVHQRDYPMGPFELGDLTGIDVSYHVRREADLPIPPIMNERFEAGEYGRKTGTGYYEYDDGDGPTYESGDGEGFDTLRVEARMVNEAAALIGNDVATAEAIDTGMRLGAGFPEGPCRRADAIGLDTVLETLRTLYEEMDEDRYKPADHLVELVEAGKTGQDAGKGFFEYENDTENEAETDSSSYFERVSVGDTVTTGGRTITETDVVNFAGVSGDFNHHHTNEERMQKSSFDGRIAHGALVFSVMTGLLWQSRTEDERDAVVAFYGVDHLRFSAPTYVGDTVHVDIEVTDKRERDHPVATGVVVYEAVVKKQDGTAVISCELLSLVQ